MKYIVYNETEQFVVSTHIKSGNAFAKAMLLTNKYPSIKYATYKRLDVYQYSKFQEDR
uniref:Uncharacterized protein n=1 Tax=viral metagenome TaxID=1070528 RepID=A0A6M3K634_9ZZZZ